MFRRESRDSIERQLSQFRQQLEQTALDEEALLDEERATLVSSEPSAPVSPRTTPWQPEPPVRSPAPVIDRTQSVLAANARWEGTIRTEGSMVIHGTLRGSVQATQDVIIAEGAEVEAEIVAQNVIVRGIAKGRIEAKSRLELFPQGQVVGEVYAPSLVVHEGARLSGKLKMEPDETTTSSNRSSGGRP